MDKRAAIEQERKKRKQPRDPISIWEALGEEHWHLTGQPPSDEYNDAIRAYKTAWQRWANAGKPESGEEWERYNEAQLETRAYIVGLISGANRSALCLSGGGIRSATFGLGVLQGLARRSAKPDGKYKLLGEIDYLSTVSGGGYLGSWFSSWACRAGLNNVLDALSTPPRDLFDPEPKPLRHLRNFSNYLNPKLGFTSADTWTLVATVIRNLLLNWLVLLPFAAAALIVPQLFGSVAAMQPPPEWIAFAIGLIFAVASIAYMVNALPRAGRFLQPPFLLVSVSTTAVSSVCFALYWVWRGSGERDLLRFVLFGIEYMIAGAVVAAVIIAVRKQYSPGIKTTAACVATALAAAIGAGAFAGWIAYLMRDLRTVPGQWVALGIGLLFGVISIAYMVTDLPSAGNFRQSQARFNILALSTMIVSSICFALFWSWGGAATGFRVSWFVAFGMVYMAAGILLGGVAVALRVMVANTFPGFKTAVKYSLLGFVTAVLTGAFSGWLGYNIGNLFVDGGHVGDGLYAVFAVPALVSILFFGQTILIGLTSDLTSDPDREWWARAAAWYLIVIVFWSGFAAASIWGTAAFLWLKAVVTGAVGWAASRLGSSSKTSSGRQEEENKKLPSLPAMRLSAELMANLLLFAFLVLLAILLAAVDTACSGVVRDWALNPPGWAWWSSFSIPQAGAESIVLLFLLALGSIASFFVDVNKFSLHAMYRSRLIRAYLGASNEDRHPHPLIGFDEHDNLALNQLRGTRPFHVVNIALNLVKGENLAWQQRKAESFTATPLHAGSCRIAYQDTKNYGRGDDGMTLGGAVTISGAAASPNMGYHSSPLLTIVMALFNARLGAWLANPGPPGRGVWANEGPRWGIRSYSDEVFGQTDDANAWVYLSDGGHFENLGIYEMVLRRMKNIVAVDAGADPKFQFEDLGNAIRKIRVDLGIPINFGKGLPLSKDGGVHVAIGTIQYDAVDEGACAGTIVYIKPSLCGKEPSDVSNYKAQNDDFPHQPTPDQWFDEAQFESYRQLGLHIVDELYDFSDSNEQKGDLDDFVRRARAHARVVSGAGLQADAV